MNERIKKLRRQSVDTPARIYMERADLMTDAYKMYEGSVSVPEMRALAFKYFMEHKHLCINDGELIVGEKATVHRNLLPSRNCAATLWKTCMS